MLTQEHVKKDSRSEDYKGKVLIVDPEVMHTAYQKPEHQLWRATGGFGCNPQTMGRAVFAENIATGEKARWERYDFLGVAKDEVIEQYKGVGQNG